MKRHDVGIALVMEAREGVCRRVMPHRVRKWDAVLYAIRRTGAAAGGSTNLPFVPPSCSVARVGPGLQTRR